MVIWMVIWMVILTWFVVEPDIVWVLHCERQLQCLHQPSSIYVVVLLYALVEPLTFMLPIAIAIDVLRLVGSFSEQLVEYVVHVDWCRYCLQLHDDDEQMRKSDWLTLTD
jgi:hypothetical protein